MAIPVEVTFKDLDHSEALEARIREKAALLERFATRILRCHVTIETPNKQHRQGRLFRAHVEISMPGGELVTARTGPQDSGHEDPYVAVRDAFDAAVRRLEDRVRVMRGDVKHHETHEAEGRILRFIAGEEYGFIELADGQEVYFHRNAVHHAHFAELRVGDRVRVIIEEGEKGPQAGDVRKLASGVA